jgi:hypothetical protein
LSSATIQEVIQLDFYIPHALVGKVLRVYQVENKVVALIDKMQLGIGYLDYTDGQFIPMPPISGYAHYKMVFVLEEGRPNFAKR